MVRWQRGWQFGIGIGVILFAAAVCGGETKPAGVPESDNATETDKTTVFSGALSAVDEQTVVVNSRISGEQSISVLPVDAGQPVPRQIRKFVRDHRSCQVEASWQQVDWRVPGTAKNLADVALGAKFSGFAVSLQKPVEINTVVIHTVGEIVYGRNRCGIRDYQLRCHLTDGKWVTVATVRNNTKGRLVHTLPPLATDEVRIDVTAFNRYKDLELWKSGAYRAFPEPFPPPPLRGIELYRLEPVGTPTARSKTRQVTIDNSAKGRIAIFKDDVPTPDGVPSSPNALAEVLRRAGYGVTFLDAELLSRTSLLSREYFDLFVQPYGCSFPMGSTLYQFLGRGGHLLTLGGQAFTNALERLPNGQLVATGLDPGIITTPVTMPKLDCYEPFRDQIGMFAGPFQSLEHVVSAHASRGQKIIDPAIRINQALAGYPAVGLVGQVIPIKEEEEYVRQGKELPYILDARAEIRRAGKFHSILDGDHNYLTFNKPCARWVPLLETHDRFGRPRGAAAAMILNHDGIYAGSTWAFFGVTNCDLFPSNNDVLAQSPLGHRRISALRSVPSFTASARTYDCYRQGEPAKVRVFAANYGPVKRTARRDVQPSCPRDGEQDRVQTTSRT